MKILSLLQPWATLVVTGAKLVETRSWQTPYRGPVFIHASGDLNKKFKGMDITPALTSLCPHFKDFIKPQTLQFGRIVGMCEIVTCVRTEDIAPTLSEQELAFGDYTKGRWAWQLSNHVSFDHAIPIKGQLGLIKFVLETRCKMCDSGHFPTDKFHVVWVAGKKQEVIRCQNIL
jgi:hypothetical protein